MDKERLKELLRNVKKGSLSIDRAMERLKHLPFEELGWATLDHHRHLRKGFPEVILGEEKTGLQLMGLIHTMSKKGNNILVTRVDEKKAEFLKKRLPKIKYNKDSMTVTLIKRKPIIEGKGVILIICAGTSDIPVAEEAAITAELMGNRIERLYDVGVAGIHRVLSKKEKLMSARVLIVIAGMEGALPSVVGGLVDKPVIAVPTSRGYGASFKGITALLGMINSCSPGVTVVNIDNGFGAGYVASLINKL